MGSLFWIKFLAALKVVGSLAGAVIAVVVVCMIILLVAILTSKENPFQ